MKKYFSILYICTICISVSLWMIMPKLARADITSNLIGWWKFDEGSGTNATDSGSGGHSGTLTGVPTYVAGKIGTYALSFNPAHPDYVNIGNNDGQTGDFTISAWVKPNNFSGYNGIISKTNPGGPYPNPIDSYILPSSGKVTFVLGNGGTNSGSDYNTITSNSTATVGQWDQWILTYVASTKFATLYFDGVLDISGTISFTGTANGTGNFLIGTRNDMFTNMDGSIDDVRIYNRALSSADVAQLYAYTGIIIPTYLIKLGSNLVHFIYGHIVIK